MTNEEIKAEIARLQAELAVRESMDWKPRDGEGYWTISSSGEPSKYRWSNNDGGLYDMGRYTFGNVFRTQEAAEKERGRRIGYYRALRVLKKHANGFVPDWANRIQEKHAILWDAENNKPDREYFWSHKPSNLPVFATKEDRDAAIAEAGDDLKYLFMEV